MNVHKLFPTMERDAVVAHLHRCQRTLRADRLQNEADGASVLATAEAMAHLVGGGLVAVGRQGLVAHLVAPGGHWLTDIDGYRLHLLIAEAVGLVHDCIDENGGACSDCWDAALDVVQRGLAPEGVG